MTDEMKSIDRAMYVFMKQEEIAKNFLKAGLDPELVAQNTEVPLYMVLKLKEEMELAEAQLLETQSELEALRQSRLAKKQNLAGEEIPFSRHYITKIGLIVNFLC